MTAAQPYPLWIRNAIAYARFWLRKMGLNAEQRALFWAALSEHERREGDGDTWLKGKP